MILPTTNAAPSTETYNQLTVILGSGTDFPSGDLTVEATLYRIMGEGDDTVNHQGTLVLSSEGMGSSAGIQGTRPKAGVREVAVRVLPFERSGNLGESGRGYIKFVTRDSNGSTGRWFY